MAGVLKVLAMPRPPPLGPADPGSTPATRPLATLRSLQLSGDLLCVAALHGLTSNGTAPERALGVVGGTSQHLHTVHRHPLLLLGSHNRELHAYSVEHGGVIGTCQPHEDAVCCCAPVLATHLQEDVPPARFVTASWDCSVKVGP